VDARDESVVARRRLADLDARFLREECARGEYLELSSALHKRVVFAGSLNKIGLLIWTNISVHALGYLITGGDT